MVEKRGREALHLVPQGRVLLAVLRLHLGELLQLVGQHEGGEDGVGAGERDQGGGREGLVGVQPGETEPQTVLLAGQQASTATALDVVRRRHARPTVDQELEDLVVVLVGGQGERGDIRGVGGGDWVYCLPGVRVARLPDPLLVSQQQLNSLECSRYREPWLNSQRYWVPEYFAPPSLLDELFKICANLPNTFFTPTYLNVFLINGQKQGVKREDARIQKDFHQLRVFVDDRDGEGGPSERIFAVDVEELAVHVALDHLGDGGTVAPLCVQHESSLLVRQRFVSSRVFPPVRVVVPAVPGHPPASLPTHLQINMIIYRIFKSLFHPTSSFSSIMAGQP